MNRTALTNNIESVRTALTTNVEPFQTALKTNILYIDPERSWIRDPKICVKKISEIMPYDLGGRKVVNKCISIKLDKNDFFCENYIKNLN